MIDEFCTAADTTHTIYKICSMSELHKWNFSFNICIMLVSEMPLSHLKLSPTHTWIFFLAIILSLFLSVVNKKFSRDAASLDSFDTMQ